MKLFFRGTNLKEIATKDIKKASKYYHKKAEKNILTMTRANERARERTSRKKADERANCRMRARARRE